MVDNIVKINPNEYTVLDVGCGMRKYKGKEGQRVIGIDKVKTPCVDIVYDIDKGIPVPDSFVDMVYMDNSFGHKLFFNTTIMDGFKQNDPMSFMFPGIVFSEVKVRLRSFYMTKNNMKKYPKLMYLYYFLFPILRVWETVMNIKPVLYEKFSETISPFTNIFELEFRLTK